MRGKKLFVLLIVVAFFILGFNNISYATDLDEIVDYEITVEPRNDSTLDIIYDISWKVLDSSTEGPLEWVQIGTPNLYFDTPTALSNNISNINSYNGSYVKLTFDRAYYEGETITFRYSIHQTNMCTTSGDYCIYKFTPAWFTDANVDYIKIRWDRDNVAQSDNMSIDGNYLVWEKNNLAKGEKVTINVKYKQSAFSTLSLEKQRNDIGLINMTKIIIIVFIVLIIISAISRPGRSRRGYYRHRGFYGGGHRDHRPPREPRPPRSRGGGCAHSSCASSCACACAGSGRAGCAKKDFYGTNLKSKEIRK